MTRKELVDALDEYPATAKIVIRLPSGDVEIDSICGEDIVPPDVDANPQGRIINGIVAVFPKAS